MKKLPPLSQMMPCEWKITDDLHATVYWRNLMPQCVRLFKPGTVKGELSTYTYLDKDEMQTLVDIWDQTHDEAFPEEGVYDIEDDQQNPEKSV